MKPVVSLKNISYTYQGVAAVSDINLEIERGEFLGLIGPNGSGKTTLLKIMLGLLTPQKGSVQLFGTPMAKFKDWTKIGYVPQRASLSNSQFPISVEEVVAMSGASQEKVTEALAEVGLTDKRSVLLRELSGGQQQRVFIARALASNPELLLLDEPTVGVDTESQEKFYSLLKKLNKELELTLVLVSHDIDVVAHEVTQVACLNNTLITHGSPKKVLKEGNLDKLYGKQLKFVVHGH